MNDPIDDKTLQEYLAGNSPVSQRYGELAGDDVPAHLDELVLKQSRDAVGTVSLEQERLRRSRQRLKRWSIPATLAASTVLVVSIVIESGNRHQVTDPLEAPSQVATVEESAPAAPYASDKLEAERQAPPASSPAVPPSEKRSKVAPAAMARKPSDAGAGSQFVESPKSDAKSSAASEEVAVAALRKQEPPQNSPVAITTIPAQGNISPAARPSAASPPATMAPAPLSQNATAMQSSGTNSSARRERAAAESKDLARDAEADVSEVAVTGSRVNRLAAPTAGPRDTISQNAATDARADVADEAVDWRAQPEAWLAHIRQLRADGSNDEADKEWKRFRKAHPDYTVAETDIARAKR